MTILPQSRILIAAVIALTVGASCAHGQTRSWQQLARIPTRPAAPTIVAARPAPNPAPASYPLPATPTATLGRVIPGTAYPLPAAAPTQPSTAPMPTTVPSYPLGNQTPSPYVAPYLTAQQPTPAPPLDGLSLPTFNTAPAYSMNAAPVNVMPSLPGTMTPGPAMWPDAAAPATTPLGASMLPPPQSPAGPASMLSSSCDPNDPAAVYDPGDPAVWVDDPRGCGPWFWSVTALLMKRGVPNNVELTYLDPVPQISVMNSEMAARNQLRGGAETRFGRAIGDRWAVEGVYFFLDTYANQIAVHSDANQLNSRLDFQDLFYQGSPLSTVFNNSRDQRFLRESIFENIEINLIQQAMLVDPASRFGMTSFAGVRYFRFDDLTHLEATAANVDFGTVDNTSEFYSDYRVTIHNRMTGVQTGSRIHANLFQRLRVFAMPRFGLFANRIGQYQHVCRVINLRSDKTDVALMGQLDLGLSYQVLPCVSLVGGYRAIAISGVATADDNIARTFTSLPAMASINSSGSLILHGWTMGIQAQF